MTNTNTNTTGITVQPYEYEMVLLEKVKRQYYSVLYGKNNLRQKQLREEQYRKDMLNIENVSRKYPLMFKKGKVEKQLEDIQDGMQQQRNMQHTIRAVLDTHKKEYKHAIRNYENASAFNPSTVKLISALNTVTASFQTRDNVEIDLQLFDAHGEMPTID